MLVRRAHHPPNGSDHQAPATQELHGASSTWIAPLGTATLGAWLEHCNYRRPHSASVTEHPRRGDPPPDQRAWDRQLALGLLLQRTGDCLDRSLRAPHVHRQPVNWCEVGTALAAAGTGIVGAGGEGAGVATVKAIAS